MTNIDSMSAEQQIELQKAAVRLSQDTWAAGFEAGRRQGYEEGYDKGFDDGFFEHMADLRHDTEDERDEL